MIISILDTNITDNKLTEQIEELFKQLSPDKDQQSLTEILCKNNQVSVAYCVIDDVVVGIACMGTYRVISGHKGWIEDVIVDKKFRGRGIGRNLIEKLLNIAKVQQLTEVLLFTEDHRTAAKSLYENLNFKTKGSTIYIWKRD